MQIGFAPQQEIQSQPPELPLAFKDRIKSMGASPSEAVLSMQKSLENDDVNSSYNRLQINLPINQLNDPPFVLNEEEREGLNSERKVRVLMLDPSCINTAPYYVYLGKVYYNYYLGLNWFEVVQRNDLREGMVVQLWSFRVGSDPCFALVLEDKQNYGR